MGIGVGLGLGTGVCTVAVGCRITVGAGVAVGAGVTVEKRIVAAGDVGLGSGVCVGTGDDVGGAGVAVTTGDEVSGAGCSDPQDGTASANMTRKIADARYKRSDTSVIFNSSRAAFLHAVVPVRFRLLCAWLSPRLFLG